MPDDQIRDCECSDFRAAEAGTPSVSVIRRCGMGRVLLAAGGEQMVTDLPDGVVQMLESFGDPLPRHRVGTIDRSLQAQTDTEQAADDLIEQFRPALSLLGRDRRAGKAGEIITLPGLGDVADHREGELAGCGRHRAEADLNRERGLVLTQPDQPRPGAHRPGPGCPPVGVA
jgi:hypothetical protein